MRFVPRAFRRVDLGVLREGWRAFRPALLGLRGAVLLAASLALLLVAAETLQPWPIKIVFDALFRKSGTPPPEWLVRLGIDRALLLACSGLLVLALVLGALRIATAVLGAYVGRKVTTRIRRQVFEHLHRLDYPFHLRQRSGDLLVRLMGDVNMVRDLLFTSWLSLFQRGLGFVAMAGFMLVVDPMLGLWALLPLPFLGIFVGRSSRRLRQVAKKQRAQEGSAAAFAAETLRQIRVVKAYGAELLATKTFVRDSRSGERAGAEGAKITSRTAAIAELLTATGLGLVLFTGAHRVQAGTLSAGTLWLFIAYARSLYKPLRGLTREGVRLGRATACAERLLDLLRQPAECTGGGPKAPRYEGAIRFEDVRFRYDSGVPALAGASFEIRPGTLALLAGKNGSGKSTTLGLLLRLFRPESGAITIDGHRIETFELAGHRAQFAYVPQEIQLFGASVRENIAYGRPGAKDEDIVRAAKAALVHDVIERLPRGYDTELSEAGTSLSGGEARRVMLARAALRDARILLLDEPLAGLDPGARPLVAKAIRSIAAGRTTLVVSHETIQDLDPDQHIELDHGVVVPVDGAAEGGTAR